MKKDRIVYLAQAALTVRETIWFKNIEMKRSVHALPHSPEENSWVEGNVHKLVPSGTEAQVVQLIP
jgi:hypothetical protein